MGYAVEKVGLLQGCEITKHRTHTRLELSGQVYCVERIKKLVILVDRRFAVDLIWIYRLRFVRWIICPGQRLSGKPFGTLAPRLLEAGKLLLGIFTSSIAISQRKILVLSAASVSPRP
jgi:hypothetical protein